MTTTKDMTFEEKIARLREFKKVGGVVKVQDFFAPPRAPYRHASLDVQCEVADYAEHMRTLAALAVEIGAHLTMYTHHHCGPLISVAISRDLTAEEIGEPPCVIRPVTQ